MNDSLIHSTALSDYAASALSHALAAMRPGWIVLRDCMLAADGADGPARVQYALLHAKVGVALLDIIPGPTTANAAARLKRQLDAAGFSETFHGTPEIRYLCVPLRVVPDIARLLDQEFGQQPSSMLPRSEAWVALAKRLLLPQSPQPAPDADIDDLRQRSYMREGSLPAEGRRSVRLLGSTRWLGVFWGLIATTVGGGVLLLQYLGPPAERLPSISAKGPELAPGIGSQPKAILLLRKPGSFADGGPALSPADEAAAVSPVSDAAEAPYTSARARDPIDAELQRAMIENEQAIAELENRLKNFEPDVEAGLSAEATTLDVPSDRPSTRPATTTDRSLSGPVPTFAEKVADLSALTPPPAAVKLAAPVQAMPMPTATAVPASATAAVVRPADGLPIDAPSRSQADGQEVSPVPTAAMTASAPALPDALPGKSLDAPAVTAAVDSAMPAISSNAGPDLALVQSPSQPSSFDLPPSRSNPAGTTEAPVFMEAASSQNLEIILPSASPTSTLAEIMIRRADALLQRGDVSAARLLYERAAAAGSGRAATAMGKTFEATFLAAIGVTGMSADPALAAVWYRRALSLGDLEARTRLQAVPPATSRTSASQAGRL